jgi:hypothetical protein
MTIQPIRNPRQKLLVEGPNDLHVVGNIWKDISQTTTPYIVSTDGFTNLLPQIPVRLKEGNEVLGVIVDADLVSFEDRWKQVKHRFEESGYKLPSLPPIDGIVVEQTGLTKIGIWIMPNNQSLGKIEDFLQHLVPVDDALLVEAEGILDSIESQAKNLYAEKDRPKALMHTWLAWQKTPGMPYGQAITAKALTTDSELCQRFIDWLKRLFM